MRTEDAFDPGDPGGLYFDDREVGTLLAALCLWQRSRPSNPELHAIATNGGEFKALDDHEIDHLCMKVNC